MTTNLSGWTLLGSSVHANCAFSCLERSYLGLPNLVNSDSRALFFLDGKSPGDRFYSRRLPVAMPTEVLASLRVRFENVCRKMSSRKLKKALAKKIADAEMAKMAKAQIVRLSRQYKVMEGSRMTYEEEMNIQLAKQKAQLAHLQEEKENLSSLGVLAAVPSVKIKDKDFKRKLIFLLEQKTVLEKNVRMARSDLRETKTQLMKADHELIMLRTKRKSDSKGKQHISHDLIKRMSLLETKLSIAHVELNKVMTKNGVLREEIEHLLKERFRFKELLDEQLTLLKAGKKSMLDMIEQSTIAFEHREESQAKLDALSEKNVSLKETHTQQMRDLDRLLFTDTERVQFLTIKGQYRTNAEINSKKEAGGLIRKQDIENLTNAYNTLLAGISPFTDAGDKIDVICETYRTNEDENFAIFNYVNEVNCEAESLHDAAKAVKKKIDRERALKVERVAQQSEDVRSLGIELGNIEQEIEDLKTKKNKVAENLFVVTEQLNGIVQKVQCQYSPFYNLLGENTSVNLNNVHLFLLVLEKQIIRIMKKIMEREKSIAVEEQSTSKESTKSALRKHKLRLNRKNIVS